MNSRLFSTLCSFLDVLTDNIILWATSWKIKWKNVGLVNKGGKEAQKSIEESKYQSY